MFEGLEGLLGKLYKEDDQGQQQEPTFLANLTGVPNTDGRGQGFALAAALANAGSAISNANRPSVYGAPSMGNLLSAGTGGFINGLGMQAMMRQKAMIDQAKATIDMAKFQQSQEEHGLKMGGMGLSGDAENFVRIMGRMPSIQELIEFKKAGRAVTNVNVGDMKFPEATKFSDLENSLQILGEIEKAIFNEDGSYNRGRVLNSHIPTSNDAMFKNMAMQAIYSKLRADSGAAITPKEMETYMEMYFPSPLDSANVAKNKLQRLRNVLTGTAKNMGRDVKTYPAGKTSPTEREDLTEWEDWGGE